MPAYFLTRCGRSCGIVLDSSMYVVCVLTNMYYPFSHAIVALSGVWGYSHVCARLWNLDCSEGLHRYGMSIAFVGRIWMEDKRRPNACYTSSKLRHSLRYDLSPRISTTYFIVFIDIPLLFCICCSSAYLRLAVPVLLLLPPFLKDVLPPSLTISAGSYRP